MRETPRPQATAGGSGTEPPQPRPGRALAHTTGASGSGSPHRSDSRPPHTPRGARRTGPGGRPGTTPPVPGRPAFLSATLLALFGVITWQVAAHGPLARLDERASRALVGHGPAPLTELLADLGNMQVALPVLAAALAYAVWRGRRAEALCAGLAMALVPAVVVPLKLLVDRVGPLTSETGYYPSGHTATALVAYCGAALLVHRRLLPVAVLLTVATGIGLVLRGYHWPLDVLASGCLFATLLPAARRLHGLS
ncbi:phosphatase PAP2 family protein [Streptomyces sp. CB03234]|uniref:phosphatase PAP2 family protein n=1 Tax=Streptomyces sp. (strain CB03234) TaxID=1703937 RepID=UPI00093CC688|nr:phosphatase PAP2 family protein [Streptomyces sp. CB03234]